MNGSAPRIDPRNASAIARDVTALAAVYAPDWTELDPASGATPGVGAALVSVFARFAEIVIQRLNQVPHKNFLAFLDLLGASRLPPQPARVPLTFFLSAGSMVDALVPAGTQVAAPPADGDKTPVVFETDRDLIVTAASLSSVFVRDPEQDMYADYSSLVLSPSYDGERVFQGQRRIDHILYFGQGTVLGLPRVDSLQLSFDLTSNTPDTRALTWEVWNGTAWQDRTPPPARDLTQSLRRSGTIDLGPLQLVPVTVVNGVENRWVRCRLSTPITTTAEARAGMERAISLPFVQRISMRADLAETGLAGDTAFVNLSAVDLSREFFPFSERPAFGDTFWFGHPEAFARANAKITLSIDLSNPPGSSSASLPPPKASADLRLRWEVWGGASWITMGTSKPGGPETPIGHEFTDTTNAFTKPGDVTFRLPSNVAATAVNGVERTWVRVRIVSGNYGRDARYELKVPADPSKGYEFFPATLAPPAVRTITVARMLRQESVPETVLTCNDGEYDDVTPHTTGGVGFTPFRPATNVTVLTQGHNDQPALYLGFTLPRGRDTFPNRPISLFTQVTELAFDQRTTPWSPGRSAKVGKDGSVTHSFWLTNTASVAGRFTFSVRGTRWQPPPAAPGPILLAAGESQRVDVSVTIPRDTPPGSRDRGLLTFVSSADPSVEPGATFMTAVGNEPSLENHVRLVWEYWNGLDWSALNVRDDTRAFTTPGVIEFLAPADFATRRERGLPPRYWLRVRREAGEHARARRLTRVLLNTTIAAHATTIRMEVIGSSDGSSGQVFGATQTPILPDPVLEVREPELPSSTELTAIAREEGADAIRITVPAAEGSAQTWVRWHEVPDFYGSGARDRHYVLDHLTGVVRMGNGVNGMIPAAGLGNVRLSQYRVGGGRAGNKPAATIVQLKTAVPYVDSVFNSIASTGGADAETLASLTTRVPRTIRHSGRAVTVEDFEDLALLASPAVARARCVPLANLENDPLLAHPNEPGAVSVIIVPYTQDPRPQPSLELLARVEDYLTAHSLATVRTSVVGPLYLGVDIHATIALASMDEAARIERAVRERLDAFLHPLTGGRDGAGWDFGRKPHHSDLYALIDAVPGVDHVRTLRVHEIDKPHGTTATGRFLVFSGTHRIDLIVEP